MVKGNIGIRNYPTFSGPTTDRANRSSFSRANELFDRKSRRTVRRNSKFKSISDQSPAAPPHHWRRRRRSATEREDAKNWWESIPSLVVSISTLVSLHLPSHPSSPSTTKKGLPFHPLSGEVRANVLTWPSPQASFTPLPPPPFPTSARGDI